MGPISVAGMAQKLRDSQVFKATTFSMVHICPPGVNKTDAVVTQEIYGFCCNVWVSRGRVLYSRTYYLEKIMYLLHLVQKYTIE